MWTRCELQVWSIDDTLYAMPLNETAGSRMQREWARLVGAEPLPLTIPAGAPVTEVSHVNGSLARCTVAEIELFMSTALVEPACAEPN